MFVNSKLILTSNAKLVLHTWNSQDKNLRGQNINGQCNADCKRSDHIGRRVNRCVQNCMAQEKCDHGLRHQTLNIYFHFRFLSNKMKTNLPPCVGIQALIAHQWWIENRDSHLNSNHFILCEYCLNDHVYIS